MKDCTSIIVISLGVYFPGDIDGKMHLQHPWMYLGSSYNFITKETDVYGYGRYKKGPLWGTTFVYRMFCMFTYIEHTHLPLIDPFFSEKWCFLCPSLGYTYRVTLYCWIVGVGH